MPNDGAKADPDITVADELDPADVAVITDGLRAYYVNQAARYDFRPLAVFVRDPQTGKVADIKTSFRSAPIPAVHGSQRNRRSRTCLGHLPPFSSSIRVGIVLVPPATL